MFSSRARADSRSDVGPGIGSAAALSSLREAERHLEKASRDKGGHRVKALEHVRAAIHQVEAGIRFDRRN